MYQGWIKLHRKLLDKAFCSKPSYLAVWLHILLLANHDEKEFFWNGGTIKIKPGQFVTGRKKLSSLSGVAERTVEDILTFFEKEGQIQQQKTTKYRLITIRKWNQYQNATNKPPTSHQQATTNKNVKNEKNLLGEQSSHLKGNDMGWNNPNDNQDDLPSIGDDGEVEETNEEKLKKENEKVRTLMEWAEKVRGKAFLDKPTQLKHIKLLKGQGISPTKIKDTFVELIQSEYWKSQDRLPDFKTVVSTLKNQK